MRRIALIIMLAGLLTPGAFAQDIVQQIVSRVPTSSRSYSQVLSKLAELERSDRVTVTRLGKSAGGRDLMCLTVHDPRATSSNTRRLFVIARQHGNEVSGTEAALALAEHFAASSGELETGTLRYLSFTIIPVANPDGAATGQRRNGNGADLNRDWAAQSQPETRLIATAVRDCRPDAIIDLHELPAVSSKASYQESFIETSGHGAGIAPWLSAHTRQAAGAFMSWLPSYGQRANVYYDGPGGNRGRCHRQFGQTWSIPSFLIEAKNGPGRSLQQRASLHVLGMLVLANHLIHCDPLNALPALPTEVQWAPTDLDEEDVEAVPSGPVGVQLVERGRVGEADDQSVQVEAEVANGRNASHVKFYVDGILRMISNTEPYCCTVEGSEVGSGDHDVSVEVVGDGGVVLAQAQQTLSVGNATAVGQ